MGAGSRRVTTTSGQPNSGDGGVTTWSNRPTPALRATPWPAAASLTPRQ